jgi:hypothetical protein
MGDFFVRMHQIIIPLPTVESHVFRILNAALTNACYHLNKIFNKL